MTSADGRGASSGHRTSSESACSACLRRTWLIARLAAHLEVLRSRIDELLTLADGALIDAVAGDQREAVRSELERFEAAEAVRAAAEARVELVCRCAPEYPTALVDLPAPPAVLHLTGALAPVRELIGCHPVAIVGSRRASPYGLERAWTLGRGLGAAGLTVVSGMAFGADAAAHTGALAGGGTTIAVLPGSADRAYPAAKRALHARIRATGAVISEFPPGIVVRRWMFPARNRIIAALAEMTIVVEAGPRSGALITSAIASELGRAIGAVPGMVTSPLAAGPNRLLAAGARVILAPQDVLEALLVERRSEAPRDARPDLRSDLARLLEAIAEGRPLPDALARAGLDAEAGLAALAELELAGHVRRRPGGRFIAVS